MSTCVFCQRPLNAKTSITFLFSLRKEQNNPLCGKCQEKFERIDLKNHCPGCSKNQEDDQLCEDCLKWEKVYPHLSLNHQALFTYNDMAKEFMEQFKFQGDLLLAETFSEEIKKVLAPYKKSHVILAVPKNQKVLEKQGYNPVEILLERAGIEFVPLRVTEIWAQQNKKKIILVDDIYKTGATILSLKVILEENSDRINETMSFSLFR